MLLEQADRGSDTPNSFHHKNKSISERSLYIKKVAFGAQGGLSSVRATWACGVLALLALGANTVSLKHCLAPIRKLNWMSSGVIWVC